MGYLLSPNLRSRQEQVNTDGAHVCPSKASWTVHSDSKNRLVFEYVDMPLYWNLCVSNIFCKEVVCTVCYYIGRYSSSYISACFRLSLTLYVYVKCHVLKMATLWCRLQYIKNVLQSPLILAVLQWPELRWACSLTSSSSPHINHAELAGPQAKPILFDSP